MMFMKKGTDVMNNRSLKRVFLGVFMLGVGVGSLSQGDIIGLLLILGGAVICTDNGG